MSSPDIKSLKRAYMGTKNNKGLMKKAIKMLDISFFSPKEIYCVDNFCHKFGPNHFWAIKVKKPLYSVLHKIGHKNISN